MFLSPAFRMETHFWQCTVPIRATLHQAFKLVDSNAHWRCTHAKKLAPAFHGSHRHHANEVPGHLVYS